MALGGGTPSPAVTGLTPLQAVIQVSSVVMHQPKSYYIAADGLISDFTAFVQWKPWGYHSTEGI